jgi:hypothetical protein
MEQGLIQNEMDSIDEERVLALVERGRTALYEKNAINDIADQISQGTEPRQIIGMAVEAMVMKANEEGEQDPAVLIMVALALTGEIVGALVEGGVFEVDQFMPIFQDSLDEAIKIYAQGAGLSPEQLPDAQEVMGGEQAVGVDPQQQVMG